MRGAQVLHVHLAVVRVLRAASPKAASPRPLVQSVSLRVSGCNSTRGCMSMVGFVPACQDYLAGGVPHSRNEMATRAIFSLRLREQLTRLSFITNRGKIRKEGANLFFFSDTTAQNTLVAVIIRTDAGYLDTSLKRLSRERVTSMLKANQVLQLLPHFGREINANCMKTPSNSEMENDTIR